MIGRTPAHVVAVRPLKDGVIADFEVTERMLRWFITSVHPNRRLARPRMVICIPSGVTGVERKAVKDAATDAGAREVYLVEEPLAAGIGAGLPISEPTGSMIVDIGGGTTEVAILSYGGVVVARSVRTGGDALDNAIIQFAKKEYSLALGERTAEAVKIAVASAFPLPDEPQAEIRGRDLVTGLPKTVTLTAEEVRTAVEEPVSTVVDAVRSTLDQCPPELSGDIMERGLVLTGGGASLRGMPERLRHETGMPVHVADDPLSCVALGAGRCVEELDAMRPLLDTDP